MTRFPNQNPGQSSPHNTGNRHPKFNLPGLQDNVGWKSWLLMAGISGLGLTGCLNQSYQVEADSAGSSPAADTTAVQMFLTSPDLSSPLQQALRWTQVKARRFVVPEDAVEIVLYVPDDQCQSYVTEEILVSRQNDLIETIELILAEQEIPSFELTGYRLKRDSETKTAILDLRVSRTSPRLLQSLSFCEQKFLLGSIKETLLNNPAWDIEQVEFTNRGHRLVL